MYSQFRKDKNLVFANEKFLSVVLPRNVIILQYLIIKFQFYFLSIGRSWELENKRKFQTLSSKSGPGRLREMVSQEVPNIVIWLGNFWYYRKLVAEERRSLGICCHNLRLDCLLNLHSINLVVGVISLNYQQSTRDTKHHSIRITLNKPVKC